MASPSFSRSPRVSSLLRFVVEEGLAGRGSLKEHELGVRVFDLKPDYDPQVDPIVRVQARQLRFKLLEYYEGDGKNDPVRIELPKGSYLPKARYAVEDALPVEPVTSSERQLAVARIQSRRWMITGIAALAILGLALFAVRGWPRSKWLVAANSNRSPAEALYLKGRYFWSKRTAADLERSVDLFTQAIVKDPAYAPAYVGLSDAYALEREYGTLSDREAWPRATAAARKAVELDPALPEAHNSLAFCLFYGDLKFPEGEAEFRRAIQLNPHFAQAHHWFGTALMSLRRFDEASAQLEEAQRLDPGSRSILSDSGYLLFHRGQTQAAIELLKQITAAEPRFRSAHEYLATIYLSQHDAVDYLAESREAAEAANDPVQRQILFSAQAGYGSGGWEGMVKAIAATCESLYREGKITAYRAAEAEARAGENPQAGEDLLAAYDRREPLLTGILIDDSFDSLRGEPAYRDVVSKLGLAEH